MNSRQPMIPQVSAREAHDRVASGGPAAPLVVDVRNPDEFARVRVPGSVLLPLASFVQRYNELPADRPLLLVCATGARSASATAFLLRSFTGRPMSSAASRLVPRGPAGADRRGRKGEGDLPG
jgi:rhodanese-related sulfurtransferase